MAELKIGSTLQKGKYEITKVLGSGNFGITYLATTEVAINGQLGQMNATVNVAIKEFYMKDLNNRTSDGSTVEGTQNTMVKNYRKKFKKEAENLAKLHHPNIVKVIEVFDENNTTYYVMEYVEGGSLDDYIKSKGHLTENEALNCTLEIGKALSYMHENRMIHLDLKPKNIMRNSKGHLFLIDFGLSKQYDENGEPESSTSIGLGTPGYAPLEQSNYKQDGTLPVTLDVYALGASLFKMLSGKTPPESSYVLNDGLPHDALIKVGVHDDVIAVVEKAMSPIKKDRYQTVTDLLKAVSKLLSNGEQTETEDEEERTTIGMDSGGGRDKVEIDPNTDEIEFHFIGSSYPGSRSYETHITEKSISLKITCYSDIIHEESFPFNKPRFSKLIETIKNLDIHQIPVFDEGATSGETLTLTLYRDGAEYYSGYIYGNEYKHFAGITDANLYLIKSEIEKCIPNFQTLLSKGKNEEPDELHESSISILSIIIWCFGLCISTVFFVMSISDITNINKINSIDVNLLAGTIFSIMSVGLVLMMFKKMGGFVMTLTSALTVYILGLYGVSSFVLLLWTVCLLIFVVSLFLKRGNNSAWQIIYKANTIPILSLVTWNFGFFIAAGFSLLSLYNIYNHNGPVQESLIAGFAFCIMFLGLVFMMLEKVIGMVAVIISICAVYIFLLYLGSTMILLLLWTVCVLLFIGSLFLKKNHVTAFRVLSNKG